MNCCDKKDVKIGIVGEGFQVNLLTTSLFKANFSLNLMTNQRNNQLGSQTKYFASLCEFARASNIIITICTDGPELENILFDDDGIANQNATNKTIIDMSPISPELIQEISEQLTEKEISFIDAVIINEDQEESGAIQMILVGGEENAYQRVLPIFQCIANSVKHIGVNGASQFYRQAFGVREISN